MVVLTCYSLLLTTLFFSFVGTTEGILSLRKASLTSAGVMTEGLAIYGVIYIIATIMFYFKFNQKREIFPGNWIIFTLFAYSFISIIWSLAPLMVVKSSVHFLGMIFLAAVMGQLLNEDGALFIRNLAIFSGIMAAASIFIVVFYPKLGIFFPEEGVGQIRWAGIARQPNTLGIMCIIGVLSNMLVIMNEKTIFKIIALLSLILVIICLRGSHSVSSILIFLFLVLGFISLKIFFYETKLATKLILIFIYVVGCIVLMLALYSVYPHYFDYTNILKYFGRDASMTGRTQLWDMAFKAFHAKVLFGWSFDNLGSLFQVGAFKHKLIYGQFHNGYLDLLVRGGIIGFILTGLFILYTIVVTLKSDPKDMVFFFKILCVLFILIHNISEASIMRSPSLQWLILLIIFYSEYFKSSRPMSDRYTVQRPVITFN